MRIVKWRERNGVIFGEMVNWGRGSSGRHQVTIALDQAAHVLVVSERTARARGRLPKCCGRVRAVQVVRVLI